MTMDNISDGLGILLRQCGPVPCATIVRQWLRVVEEEHGQAAENAARFKESLAFERSRGLRDDNDPLGNQALFELQARRDALAEVVKVVSNIWKVTA
jgi:hypothetical protein